MTSSISWCALPHAWRACTGHVYMNLQVYCIDLGPRKPIESGSCQRTNHLQGRCGFAVCMQRVETSALGRQWACGAVQAESWRVHRTECGSVPLRVQLRLQHCRGCQLCHRGLDKGLRPCPPTSTCLECLHSDTCVLPSTCSCDSNHVLSHSHKPKITELQPMHCNASPECSMRDHSCM